MSIFAIQPDSISVHRNGSTGALRQWLVRRRIDLLAAQVPGVLSNVPALIDESVLPSEIFSVAGAAGGDIRFTTDLNGNNPIDLDIESWDPGGTTAKLWIRVPSLSSITNTPIYLFYGRLGAAQPAAGAAGGSQGVWDSNYTAVYHLPTGSPNTTVADSTSNGRTGTKLAAGQPFQSTGKIGEGQRFDSNDDEIDTGTYDPAPGGNLTLEMWVNWLGNDGSSFQVMLAKQFSRYQFYWRSPAAENEIAWANGTTLVTFGSLQSFPATSTWFRIVLTHVNGGTPTMWIDETSYAGSGSISWGGATTAPVKIGSNGAAGEAFNGTLDEVRISNVIRSNDWIVWSYRNQNLVSNTATLNPLTF